ncbi:MAG TPA: aminodeoxychorismate/anthranilate synthase component II [Bacteroidota bacterium]|nr:aminodeoxychorismate/anthranilate synthase component II [Bacteroidota bacterium]
MFLIIDNYDSFTYNLVQYMGELHADMKIVRNDKITLDEIHELRPEGIVISPGPCTPKEAGVSVPVITRFAPDIPILGVCLGHQSIGEAFGGNVVKAEAVVHGKTSTVHHNGKGIFQGIPQDFTAARYHSLVISQKNFPEALEITALSDDNTIMGVRHRTYPVFGVQFHPESIATQFGKTMLENFILRRY